VLRLPISPLSHLSGFVTFSTKVSLVENVTLCYFDSNGQLPSIYSFQIYGNCDCLLPIIPVIIFSLLRRYNKTAITADLWLPIFVLLAGFEPA
jgi:hypothetical protein